MAGLKSQVLGRLEKLGLEREELLTEFVPATGTRGYDTGAVNAVLGG